jgi:hypothetical protein
VQVRVLEVDPGGLSVVQVGVPTKCGLAASALVMKDEDSANPSAAATIAYVTLIFDFVMFIDAFV